MGKFVTYELRIEPKYYKDVYRIIRIDGDRTLDDLSNVILSAFDFDNDHLYMFSLSRNRYDNEGYFHPEVSGKKSASEVSINELNLKVRNKLLFLYDFGDEWLFDITVKKIDESDILSLTYIKEKNGEIEQYSYMDEEEWEDECEDFYNENDYENNMVVVDSNYSMIDLLSKNKTTELKVIMKKLGIKAFKASKDASKVYSAEIVKYLLNNKESLLDLLTPSATYLLLCIASKDTEVILSEIMRTFCLDQLISLGLVDISDVNEVNSIEVTKELYLFGNFFNEQKRMNSIKQNHELQKTIIALINLYGVTDIKFLHQSLCEYLKINIDQEVIEKRVIEPLVFWDEMDVLENEYIEVATLFNETQTQLILSDRNNYDVCYYKKFEAQELSTVISEGIAGLVPSSNDLLEYFVSEKRMNPSIAAMFMAELSLQCLMTGDEDFIIEMCREKLNDYSLKLTKKVKNIILKFIHQHPCSILMGYSWDEYNNRNKAAQHQINLFDDDIPF